MRLAVVWLLSLSALIASAHGAELPVRGSGSRIARAAAPGSLPAEILHAADAGELSRPAPLLVQDVDRQGRVRILREAYLNGDDQYINDGRFREVDLSQRLVREGRFANGRRDGFWVQIHRGPLPPLFRESPYQAFEAPFYSEADFREGRLHGAWRIFDARRRLVSEIHFVDGVREGLATWMHITGKPMRKMQFRGGAPHGAMRVFDENGYVILREDFDAGRRLFAATKFYTDNDTLESAGFFLDAHLRAVTPDDWERCELARFQPMGKPAKHGVYTKWHHSGEKAVQGEFIDNLPTGEFQWWFPSGETRTIGGFVAGKPHGLWRWWREDGSLEMEGEYRGGEPVGAWRRFDKNGEVQGTEPRLLTTPEVAKLLQETTS